MNRIEKLFDFSQPFDAQLLDEITRSAYNGQGQEQKTCMDALTEFQKHPETWNRVDQILERCQQPQSKFIGLAAMGDFIQTRWKTIEKEQREAIKGFLINLLVKEVSVENPSAIKLYLKKLDLCIIELLKQEWPHEWPNFIPELISSSRNNLAMCENNMQILLYLSEEIYDFSEERMTQKKIKILKVQMEDEFSQVFQLCMEVLEKANTVSLITATLETLLRFLNWIPIRFVFESDLLNILCNRFLVAPAFRNLTIKCMSQIVSQPGPQEYNSNYLLMFNVVLQSIKQTIPVEIDLAEGYESGGDNEQEYVQNVALFFTGFLDKHLALVEKEAPKEDLLLAHLYLVKISQVEEREVFKICLEYWNRLLSGLFAEIKSMATQTSASPIDILLCTSDMLNNAPLRKHIYSSILSNLRVVIIDRMVKPEEVLIVENEDGEVIREFSKETATITLYKSMRECLVYLTHMDVVDTEQIMTRKLAFLIDETAWSRNKLNTLCWSIGSISGAMNEDMEKQFLVHVIKDLLGLCDIKRGKDNKAIVASNIMYIVGQYPRFLRAHWKFLKTVVNKLFEFMHESHEGVQDMACDTFMQIAQSCKKHFLISHTGDETPYINTIILALPDITRDLTATQTNTVHEACGQMISAHHDASIQSELLKELMSATNTKYFELMQIPNLLENNDLVKLLGYCLKANTAVCRSTGPAFVGQLSLLFNDLLSTFKTCSIIINGCIETQGAVAVQTPKVRNLRIIRKESLRLLETYINQATDIETISSGMLPSLIDNYLLSYKHSISIAREAEILDLFSTLTSKLKGLIAPHISTIFDSVLQCTIETIKDSFTEFPDIRASFYNLLHKLIQNCLDGVLHSPIELFDCLMVTIVFGFKHTMRDISETALAMSFDLFKNIINFDEGLYNSFYQAFLFKQIHEVIQILFDAGHKNGFNSQCKILALFFSIMKSNTITIQLNDPFFPRKPEIASNSQYLNDFVVTIISQAYSHLSQNTVLTFVEGLSVFCDDFDRFKSHVRDFLISLKEFGDDSSLYQDDNALELLQKKEAEREMALTVPGLVKPADLPPTMED